MLPFFFEPVAHAGIAVFRGFQLFFPDKFQIMLIGQVDDDMPCAVFIFRLIQADHPLTAGFKEIIFFLWLLSLNFCQLISVV